MLLVLAAIIVAVELAAVASQIAPLVRIGYEQADRPDRLVRDADLDPLSFYAPTGAFVAAQRLIPRDATYAMVVGEKPGEANPKIVLDLFRMWLLPRRYTERVAEAEYVIAYYRPSESLGVDYVEEIGLGPGVNVVRVVP
jgi:hypothetical protein